MFSQYKTGRTLIIISAGMAKTILKHANDSPTNTHILRLKQQTQSKIAAGQETTAM